MSKLKQLKEAMKSPPPERLAKIEYQSHFFQMFGISFVSLVLLIKGFWYIIFAFIFGLGISYSQGMTAYAKYRQISSLLGKESPNEFENDISPTRRRTKIINYTLGTWPKFVSSLIAVVISMFIIPPGLSRIILGLSYLISIMLFYVLSYFFLFYWIAYPIYKKEIIINGSK